MAMNVRVDIDTNTFIRFWLVIFAFALVGFLVYIGRTPLLLVGISAFLAIALTPPVNKLASLLPGKNRIAATALAYVVVVALLGGFIFLVAPPMIQQSAKFAQTVPSVVENLANESGQIREIIERYELQDQVDSAVESVRNNAAKWASNIGVQVVSGFGSFFRFAINVLIVLVMTFFMLIEGPMWFRRLWGLYINKDRMIYHKSVAFKMYKVVTSYVNGQLLVAAIAGALAGLAVFVISFFFDIPVNLAFPVAAIIAIGSLVPMFGATVGGIIAGILIAFSDIGAAVVFAVYLIIYQQVEGNLITTYIQAKTLDLSPLAVLVAVTLGTFMFGLIGGLVSIPIIGIFQVLAREYLEIRRHRAAAAGLVQKTVKKLAVKKA